MTWTRSLIWRCGSGRSDGRNAPHSPATASTTAAMTCRASYRTGNYCSNRTYQPQWVTVPRPRHHTGQIANAHHEIINQLLHFIIIIRSNSRRVCRVALIELVSAAPEISPPNGRSGWQAFKQYSWRFYCRHSSPSWYCIWARSNFSSNVEYDIANEVHFIIMSSIERSIAAKSGWNSSSYECMYVSMFVRMQVSSKYVSMYVRI